MIINQQSLIDLAPIVSMSHEKHTDYSLSWGLTEVGYDIRINQNIVLTPKNRFVLASSVEEFNMPPNLLGVVHDKSTLARSKISVFNTVIEPGWKGFLTLEIVYHGEDPFSIPRGSGIAQVIFHEIKHLVRYDGKYQNQGNKPVPANYNTFTK